jgi:hypothetical protein
MGKERLGVRGQGTKVRPRIDCVRFSLMDGLCDCPSAVSTLGSRGDRSDGGSDWPGERVVRIWGSVVLRR